MITFHVRSLQIPFKHTVQHAAAQRACAASVWVSAQRGEHVGFGEGCPREYVTGEGIESCLKFYERWFAALAAGCEGLEALRAFVAGERGELDKNPAAWCAVECALLELFAREGEQSVEGLLGLPEPTGRYVYSAVIDNGSLEAVTRHMDRYLGYGLRDFKVKLSGELGEDRAKLARLWERTRAHGVELSGVRLDANNVWAGRVEEALRHLEALGSGFVGVEEPVAAGDVEGMRRIYEATGQPIILDESLRRVEELEGFEGEAGWIINVKVSKAGGPLRAIELVDAAVARGWRVVVGAHVGETSILTRAAQLVARRAGERLMAQEGAFGDRLLAWDMTRPSLCFGAGGVLALEGEAWGCGWGVEVDDAQRG